MLVPLPELIDKCPSCGKTGKPFNLTLDGSKKPWSCTACSASFDTDTVLKDDSKLAELMDSSKDDEWDLKYE